MAHNNRKRAFKRKGMNNTEGTESRQARRANKNPMTRQSGSGVRRKNRK